MRKQHNSIHRRQHGCIELTVHTFVDRHRLTADAHECAWAPNTALNAIAVS